ncbi:MAG: GNAT family N-acetyltransferase [Acidobacteriota bacterium]
MIRGTTETRYRQEVRPADLENVRAIVESSGFFSSEEVNVAVELVEQRLAAAEASGYHFIFAEQHENVVAYSCFGPIPATQARFDLYWIAVHNNLRGQGLGRELLARTEAAILQMGGRRVYIETSSREQYQSTIRFYGAMGYQQQALLRDFYRCGDSKIVLMKDLPQPG